MISLDENSLLKRRSDDKVMLLVRFNGSTSDFLKALLKVIFAALFILYIVLVSFLAKQTVGGELRNPFELFSKSILENSVSQPAVAGSHDHR